MKVKSIEKNNMELKLTKNVDETYNTVLFINNKFSKGEFYKNQEDAFEIFDFLYDVQFGELK